MKSSQQNNKAAMLVAIEVARNAGVSYGAALYDNDGELAATSANRVKVEVDPTAHAEMIVIREAAKKIGSHKLSGYTLYSTCEPCPMCTAACIWAGVSEIYFGASIEDAAKYGKQIKLNAQKVLAAGFGSTQIHLGLLREDCLELFSGNVSG